MDSATERVAHRDTDPFHRRLIDLADQRRERRARNRMETVAVDHSRAGESYGAVVESLTSAARPRADVVISATRHECSNVEHFASGEHEHGASFAPDVGKPCLATLHSSPSVESRK
jgi:hypothetical protein